MCEQLRNQRNYFETKTEIWAEFSRVAPPETAALNHPIKMKKQKNVKEPPLLTSLRLRVGIQPSMPKYLKSHFDGRFRSFTSLSLDDQNIKNSTNSNKFMDVGLMNRPSWLRKLSVRMWKGLLHHPLHTEAVKGCERLWSKSCARFNLPSRVFQVRDWISYTATF